ncbi:MAG TPA: NAD(P)H-hydrate dehydratase [Tepidisphaeraceae bacterium]|jgi:NAD(P)H-hydrate epimerase|nr:NAD(P)H-hydrate dehydratase [Tepidisphaeraceae bacterium]
MALKTLTEPPRLPKRPREGHKGSFGRVLVVGGNDAMIGAPALAGLSALRMGAGLVQVATPRASLLAVLSVVPELVGLPLGERDDKRRLRDAADAADALVIGPGMGQLADAKGHVLALLRHDKPAVLDADALNILAAGKAWPRDVKVRAVLTPHPGEMKRLGRLIDVTDVPTDDAARAAIASKAATAFGQVVLLKGHRTVISDGRRVYVNRTGNSALSKAGTGDVLSGLIGALLAIGTDPFDAACLGAHLHGLAGEIAGKKLGLRSVLARDVVDCLSQAIARMGK